MTENNFNQNDFIRKDKVYLIAVFAFIIGIFSCLLFIKITTFKPNTEHQHEHSHDQQNKNMPGNDMMNQLAKIENKLRANPENADLWIELGNIYFDLSQYKMSIAAYEKSVQIKPGDANVLTDLGVMYRRNKQPLKAIESFEKAIQADPNHKISRMNKGIVLLYDLDDKESAIKTWEALLKIDPNIKNAQGTPLRSQVNDLKKNN